MGRKPRHQHERCKLPDAKRTGGNLAWLVVVLVTAWQTASPTLCPGPLPTMVDAGTPELPPVPETVWADSGIAGEAVTPGGPAPVPGQKPGPCESGMTEMRGVCWYKLEDRAPRCPLGSVEWSGRCWVPVNGGLKRPSVALPGE